MEFKDVNFFGNPEESEEQLFENALEAMAEEGSLARGLEELTALDAWYSDSSEHDSDEHKKIKEKIALQVDFMNKNGMADEAQRVLSSSELGKNTPESKETQDEVRQKAEALWESGDKVAALEAVLGRYIDASELQENPIFRTIILAQTADQAYGAALMIKTIEENADNKDTKLLDY